VDGIPAIYFDGRQTQPRAVTLTVAAGRVGVHGDGVHRDIPLSEVEILPPLGRTPRVLRLPEAGVCEVEDHAAFNRLAAAAGLAASALDRWERSWRWVVAACATFVLIVVALYVFGVPAAAGVVAHRVPQGAVTALSRQVLTLLDRSVFDPSEVPLDRQAALRRRLAALELPGRALGQEYVLEFRKAKALGPNAVALPDGRIVMTDALIALAKDDRELIAVAAHEAGHIDRRHGLRLFLQSSIVGLLVTWYVGDISSLAAGAPSALLEAGYSRAFEGEADAYALDVLTRNGLSGRFLADILERIDASHAQPGADVLRDYLSSHPATSERLNRLRSR
jgi:Zn-dependent protease with chaperone function